MNIAHVIAIIFVALLGIACGFWAFVMGVVIISSMLIAAEMGAEEEQ